MTQKLLHRLINSISIKHGHKRLQCYAPFNNLLIDQQGKFKICCHNNSYILGEYPNESIDNIWFGQKRKEIMSEFLYGKIPDSCSPCIKSNLIADKDKSKMGYSSQWPTIEFNSYPAQIEFLLDNTCNLNCLMCAPNISSNSTAYTYYPVHKVQYNNVFFNQIKPYLERGKFFVFSGGEPFLIPIYEKMWRYISQNNKKAVIYIQTNASVLTDDIKNIISKYRINIGVSIDSLKKEVYEKIRKNAQFEQTMKNIDFFINHSNALGNRLTIMVTPMTINANEIPEIVNFCNNKQLNFSLSILNWPVHLAVWSLSSVQIIKIINEYEKHFYVSNDHSSVFYNNSKSFQYLTNLFKLYYKNKLYCEANKDAILKKIHVSSILIEENFALNIEKNVKKLDISTIEKENFVKRAVDLNAKFYKECSALFEKEWHYYAFYIKKDTDVFLKYLLQYDNNTLGKIIVDKMKELRVLFDTKSYDRIIDLDFNE